MSLKLRIWQVDAFTNNLFEGNPAAVVEAPMGIHDTFLQQIATENNLSETAFISRNENGNWDLRWFTPTTEVRNCSHATLAAGHVVLSYLDPNIETVSFQTRLAGILTVTRTSPDCYSLTLPADNPRICNAEEHGRVEALLGLHICSCIVGMDDIVAILSNPEAVLALQPNHVALATFGFGDKPARGIAVTAHAGENRIVSRGFYPATGVDEDAVTGSLHALLAPYWCPILETSTLYAKQGKARGGDLVCTWTGDDFVVLDGGAQTYLAGNITVKLSR